MTHLGYRLERHNAHMAAVRAIQRRHQLERVERVLAQNRSWAALGLDGYQETIENLVDMKAEIEAEMMREGQQP